MSKLPAEHPKNEPQFRYSEATWLRAIVAAIPYVGSSLDLIFSHSGQAAAQRRVERVFAHLQANLEQVSENSIRRDFLETEEWMDLIRLAVERGARVRNAEHLRAIAKILKAAVTDEIKSASHAEDLIDVIAALRDEEALVLREMYEEYLQGRDDVKNYGEKLWQRLPEAMHKRLPFLLKRLEGLGLVTERTGAFLGYAGGTYNLTETGKELCAYARQS